jgi:Ca2+-binding RTX toxin-like protein
VLTFATRNEYLDESLTPQTSYDVLADTLGLRPGAPAYVTGTGAHDGIQIVGVGNNEVQVTVWSYSSEPTNYFQGDGSIDMQVYTVDAGKGILVEAGAGNDQVRVAYVDVPVEIRGGKGDDILAGSDGRDTLVGEFGDDLLQGHGGSDVYPFAAPRSWDLGTDTIVDYEGKGDRLDFTEYRHAVSVDLASDDVQYVDRGSFTVSRGYQVDTTWYLAGKEPPSQLKIRLETSGGSTGIENLIGTSYSDRLYGNELNNGLHGLWGNDMMQGRGGDDTLWGNQGDDIYLFIGSNLGLDRIYEYSSWGVDTLTFTDFDHAIDLNLNTTATQTVSPGHLQLDFASSWGIDNVYGTRFDDTIRGNGRANYLSGGAGNDTLRGGANKDKLYGEGGLDHLYGEDGPDYLDGGADWYADHLDGGSDRDTYVKRNRYTDDFFHNFISRYDMIYEEGSETKR